MGERARWDEMLESRRCPAGRLGFLVERAGLRVSAVFRAVLEDRAVRCVEVEAAAGVVEEAGTRFEEPTWLVLSAEVSLSSLSVNSKRSIAALFTAALGIRVGLRMGEVRSGPSYAAFCAKVAGPWPFRVLERFSAATDAAEDLLTGEVASTLLLGILLVTAAFGDLLAPISLFYFSQFPYAFQV